MAESDNTELASAIERLYEVFKAYKPPAQPAFCRHCVSEAEDAVLHAKPLRHLSFKELSRYSFKAISTWGTVEQFKYLLPRLFELLVQNGFNYDPEILFKKPRYGNLASWPHAEQEALNAYCHVLWRHSLEHHPLPDYLPAFASIDECLCSIGQILDDLTPLLNTWASDGGAAATKHLTDFADENASCLREKRRLCDAFWDGRQAQMQQVAEWFLTQDFSLVFEIADAAVTPCDFREELVRVILNRHSRR
jgi:hypothetical protein